MKLLFQITLLSLLVIISYIFYDKYFKETKIVEIKNNKETEIQDNKNEVSKINENEVSNKENRKGKENLIKNLKYSVELADSGKYEISSTLSQLIILENGIEIIFMEDVSAIFTDKNNKKVCPATRKLNSENIRDTILQAL